MKVAYWRCGNCGHEAEQTEALAEIMFTWIDQVTSRCTCPNCGSYTIQRATDRTFTHGDFLVVLTHNRIRGKGPRTIKNMEDVTHGKQRKYRP